MTNLDNPSNKYAKQEVERKFLLKKIPDHSVFHLKITDYYIKDSTLRLRKTEDKRGVNYKLGQKFRINKSSPMRIMHTSLYLSKYEYDLLSSLPSNTIEKTRLHYKLNQYTMAIDVFEGSLEGLIIGEVDFGPKMTPMILSLLNLRF